MKQRWILLVDSRVVTLVGTVALLVACSAQPAAQTGTPTSPPTSVATAQPSATAAGIQVNVATSSFGDHLTGPNGKSLYVLTRDSAGASTCTGECAQGWPPLTVATGQAPVAGAGVVAQLGTLMRPDGSTQVSANGAPLHYFSGDTAAGDVNGQGMGGVWFLAAPDGRALAAGTPAPCACTQTPAATPPGTGGYGGG